MTGDALPPVSVGALLAALEELDRRHRRDIAAMRSWLVRVYEGQEGTLSPLGGDGAHTPRMRSLLLDVEAVADELHQSERTVKRLIASGQLPAVKVGASTRVRWADLQRYVAGLLPVNAASGLPADIERRVQ